MKPTVNKRKRKTTLQKIRPLLKAMRNVDGWHFKEGTLIRIITDQGVRQCPLSFYGTQKGIIDYHSGANQLGLTDKQIEEVLVAADQPEVTPLRRALLNAANIKIT